MNEVIAWATFAGAWLLVAGPLYQGSVEINELDVDRAGIQGKVAAVQVGQARLSAQIQNDEPPFGPDGDVPAQLAVSGADR